MRNVLIGIVVVVAVVGLVVLVVLLWGFGTYNSLVTSRQETDASWSQVQNTYQRRADLVPNLVETVKGYAAHEREVFEAVTEARSKVGGINIDSTDPESLARFEAAQSELSSALSRLLLVVENYPQLKASDNFLALQSQLEGTENRIAVERRRFIEATKNYDNKVQKAPSNVIAGMFGFEMRPYFEAAPGAQEVPKVVF